MTYSFPSQRHASWVPGFADEADGAGDSSARFPASPDAHDTLGVFEDRNGKLDVIGQLDIAKREDIRSVRFDRNCGYVLTGRLGSARAPDDNGGTART